MRRCISASWRTSVSGLLVSAVVFSSTVLWFSASFGCENDRVTPRYEEQKKQEYRYVPSSEAAPVDIVDEESLPRVRSSSYAQREMESRPMARIGMLGAAGLGGATFLAAFLRARRQNRRESDAARDVVSGEG